MDNQYAKAIRLIFVLALLAGGVYGCYSREAVTEEKNSISQDVNPNPLSEAELRKFAGTVRKVDGEAEAHYQLALHFQDKYRHKLAIDELKQVLLRNPVHSKAYNALGVSFDNLGDHEAAIGYYKQALAIDSKLDYVYNNLGYSYLLKGDMPKAADVFQQAIALNPKEKRYRNNLGLAYVNLEKYELAFEQFRALDSEEQAEKTLARVMRDLGKGASTEMALLAIRSAPKSEKPADSGAPALAHPELAAKPAESGSGQDPVARFRSVQNGIATLAEAESFSSPQTPGDSLATEIQAALSAAAQDQEDPMAAEQAEPLKGPVIRIPPLPGPSRPQEIKTASAPAEEADLGVASKPSQEPAPPYQISAVFLPQDVRARNSQPVSVRGKIDPPPPSPLIRELRQVAPPHIELVPRMDQEAHEERVLLAASSIKAGGWQNAPEPRRTAEKGVVEVEVANGNGVKGAAGKVAEHLRRCGFKVVRVMDAQSHDHFSTKIFYYGGNLKEAQRILRAIPEISADAEFYEIESMGNHVRLLIGKDLVERNKTLTWGKPRSIAAGIGG